MANEVIDRDKTHPKLAKKSNGILLIFNQVISPTREILLPSFVVIGLVVLTSSHRQAFFVNHCHSRDLGSRSQKGRPVHLPRPMLSLSKYLRLSSNGFNVRRESCCGDGDSGGNEFKISSHPRPEDLNIGIIKRIYSTL